eukprot:3740469-Pleurochrysis_carterae.AAC.1
MVPGGDARCGCTSRGAARDDGLAEGRLGVITTRNHGARPSPWTRDLAEHGRDVKRASSPHHC